MGNKGLSSSFLKTLQARQGRLGLPYSYKVLEDGSQYGLDTVISKPDYDPKQMSIWIPFADGNRRDGVGDLLEVTGIVTDRHRPNPIALFDHGQHVHFPIGLTEDPQTKAYTVEIDPVLRQARANIFFYQGKKLDGVKTQKEMTDHALFCEQLYDLLVQGYVRGGSIGYQVIQGEALPPEYGTGTPQGMHLKSVRMIEVSTVVIPAHQDTVRKALCLGAVCGKPLSPILVKSLAPYAPSRKPSVRGGYVPQLREVPMAKKELPKDTKALPGGGPPKNPMAPPAPGAAPPPTNVVDPTLDLGDTGEEVTEPFGAQVLRRIHQDARILVEDYQEMLGPLEHESVKGHLMEQLKLLEGVLDGTERIFLECYHDKGIDPLEGANRAPMGLGEEENPLENPTEGEEGLGNLEGEEEGLEGETPPEGLEEGGEEPTENPLDEGKGKGKPPKAKGEEGGEEEGSETNTDAVPASSKKGKPPKPEEAIEGMKKKKSLPTGNCKSGKCPLDQFKVKKEEGESKEKKKESSKEAGGGPTEAEVQEEAQETPREQAVEERQIAAGIQPHHSPVIAEAKDFFAELANAHEFGHEHRLKSYHYHKMLDRVRDESFPGQVGMKIAPLAAAGAMGAAGGAEGMALSMAPGALDRVMGGGDDKGLHPHYTTLHGASGFLRGLSNTRDFGDPHRQMCTQHHAGLEEIHKGLTAPPAAPAAPAQPANEAGGASGAPQEKPVEKPAGEVSTKELGNLFSKQSEEMSVLNNRLESLFARLN